MSAPFWAQLQSHFVINMMMSLLQIYLPSYLKDVLRLKVVAVRLLILYTFIWNNSERSLYCPPECLPNSGEGSLGNVHGLHKGQEDAHPNILCKIVTRNRQFWAVQREQKRNLQLILAAPSSSSVFASLSTVQIQEQRCFCSVLCKCPCLSYNGYILQVLLLEYIY